MDRNKIAFTRGLCQAFIVGLIDTDLLCDDQLFLIMEEEANKKGYAMEAHQRGIAGTFTCFRKLT
jgi:hypothetical protein